MLSMRDIIVIGAFLLAMNTVSLAASLTRPAYYVNNRTGSDDYDGLAPLANAASKSGPFATIMQAVKKCAVGSIISIANTGLDYRESVQIEGYKKGRPGSPLVLEGNGATVSGLLPIPTVRWTLLKDDIYWTENRGADGKPLPMPNSNWLGHYRHQGWFTEKQSPEIFFVDGKAASHVRELASIPVGGFFYDTQASPRRLYFRLPAGKSLKDPNIEIPQNTGVYVSDDYVVVRNMRSIYSQDDGFAGFWGVGVVFENINGSFNCDQGFSMHGTSVSMIDGGLFERNGGCGICDVMSSTSIFRNVVVRDNMITGAMMKGFSHTFLNCRFSGNESAQVAADDGTGLQMVNCLVVGDTANGVTAASLRMDHCTVVNCGIGVTATKGSVKNSAISNCDTLIAAASNDLAINKTVLDLGKITLGKDSVTAENWATFAPSHGLSDNLVDQLKLTGPLYRLPKDSAYIKSGDYNTTPGAQLGEYRGWNPSKPSADPYPHP